MNEEEPMFSYTSYRASMIELCHLDVRHFVIEECRHLSNSCTAKCDCINLILFHYLSLLLGAIICDINTIGFVSVYACRVKAGLHEATPSPQRGDADVIR